MILNASNLVILFNLERQIESETVIDFRVESRAKILSRRDKIKTNDILRSII